MKINKRYLKFIRSQSSYTSHGITYTRAGYPIIDIKTFCKRRHIDYNPEFEALINKNKLKKKMGNMMEFNRLKYEDKYISLCGTRQLLKELTNSMILENAIIRAETAIIKEETRIMRLSNMRGNYET